MIISSGQSLDFAPQALAEQTPVSTALGYFYGRDGAVLGSHFSLYSQMYRSQPWIAAVIDKVAQSAARLTFVPWVTSDAGKVRDTASAWAKLWSAPCPVLSPFAFWRWTFSTYELYGEAFWLKVRDDNGQVIGLLPMHPARTQIKRDTSGNEVFIFSLGVASAGLLTVSADDVVKFRRYNPDMLERGLSRIEPLRSTLENEQEARKSTSSWWKRGARPSLMLSTDGKLSDQAASRLKAQVDAQHAGADKAAGTLVLEEGMKPVPVQLNAEEMQYIESRQLNREEVCGVFDVPPPVVHILDHATFTNITEQMRSMYRDTMAPRLEDMESVIVHDLLSDFDPTGSLGLSASFALDEVLRGDFETRATAVVSLIQAGVMKPAEARPLFDLPDAGPIADHLYANAALQRLGTPAERVSITETGLPMTPDQAAMAQQVQDAAAATDAQAATERSLRLARTKAS